MAHSSSAESHQEGGALILVLIFTVLLYAIVAELVTTGQTARLTGEVDVLTARMRRHMIYTEGQIEDQLLADLAAAAAGEEGAGGGDSPIPGGGGIPGAGGAGGPLGEGGEEEEPDPASLADCSQDAWFQPTAYNDNDVTTYVWVEDENRKFNILSLISPDEEFAAKSRARFVRLIDYLREDSDFDLTASDGEMIAEQFIEWTKGGSRGEFLPRPPLKSDLENERSDVTIPMHLDELMLLAEIDEDLFYDKVFDSRVILGLESVLTIYTSLVFDPGDPEELARQGRNPEAPPSGDSPIPGAPEGAGDPGEGGGEQNIGGELPEVPRGVGIKININTAPEPVLRCLFEPGEISEMVIDEIIRWRNEPVEEEEAEQEYTQFVEAGEEQNLQVFTDLEQLDEIPEFENLPSPELKEEFRNLLTVTSDVFSVHMASMKKRNEDLRTYVMQRSRSILVRVDDGDEGSIHPLILHEARRGMRIMPVDLQDERDLLDLTSQFSEMDAFTQEERAWNPFHIDFYRSKEERDELFDYRQRQN